MTTILPVHSADVTIGSMRSDWLIWQLADSAFPAGTLAHSCGVEAATQRGLIIDGESLREFVMTALQQLHCGVGVFADRTWAEPGRFAENDTNCDLFLNSTVANRASRAQGRAFLATAAQTFDIDSLKQFAADLRREKWMGHQAPVFGLVCRSLGIDRHETMRLLAFNTARACLSSAVRLGVVGPLESQRIQADLSRSPFALSCGFHEEGADECESKAQIIAVQTAPLLDLLQSTQDRLYSRLFQS